MSLHNVYKYDRCLNWRYMYPICPQGIRRFSRILSDLYLLLYTTIIEEHMYCIITFTVFQQSLPISWQLYRLSIGCQMWLHLRKGTLLRNKYYKPWSDAAHETRRLIRAYYICWSTASKENIFVAPCAVFIINTTAKVWKQLIFDDTVCSAIRYLFADDITFVFNKHH